MSIPLYLSMEKSSLESAQEHIIKMSNDNFDYYEGDLKTINIEKFSNNIKNGYIVLTMLISFLESLLNSILIYCLQEYDESNLKKSIKDKIDYIAEKYEKDKTQITGGSLWEKHNTAVKIRNELIHYKQGRVGEGVFIPDLQIAGQYIGEFFTNNNMSNLYDNYQSLVQLIADTFGLKINPDIHIIVSRGRDSLNSYIYDASLTGIDEQ